jgi:hypothetical protein
MELRPGPIAVPMVEGEILPQARRALGHECCLLCWLRQVFATQRSSRRAVHGDRRVFQRAASVLYGLAWESVRSTSTQESPGSATHGVRALRIGEAQATRLGRLCFARQKRWARRPCSRSTQIIPPSSGAASDPTNPAGWPKFDPSSPGLLVFSPTHLSQSSLHLSTLDMGE